ncbi:uncharacterized protein EAE97_009576 [Botrytis byssoidea]|uniref:Uncharacterized protein n=1 Tax=Botrytis byssoidea TaxID=139641 RepID=A0A9P5I4M3_9HELO|nr:uncharacterized protein EAE97_009576 [Botrytis byssoidea]KAF7929979.1 hypothetical protein EAE97_009576 [Botrytis byssoidea]
MSHRENEVPPPVIGCCVGPNHILNDILGTWISRTKWAKRFKRDETSKVCLILIETDDKHEFNAIWEPFISAMTKVGYFATALVFKHEGPPKVSSQTYGLENCLTNCCSQVKNILIQKEEAIRNFNEEINFHSIYVGAIGSYLQLGVKVDGEEREVEFNVALYVNPFAETFGQQGGFWHISKGATLPDRFDFGRHTVEEFRHHDSRGSDWHATMLKTGRSRHEILLECTTKIIRDHSKQLFKSEYEEASRNPFEIGRGAIYVTGAKPNKASRLQPRAFESGSFESGIFTADIWLVGKDNSERSGRRELAYIPKTTTSKPITTKTEISKEPTPGRKELTRGRSNSTTPSSAISNSSKPTRDRSNSATPKTTTSRSDRHRAISPDSKKPTTNGSKVATSNLTTTRSEISKATAPNPQKSTSKIFDSAISTPVRPKLVTRRSDRSDRSDRSKAAPSEAYESTPDKTPLLKLRSDKPKAAKSNGAPSNPARSGKETIKAATKKIDESLQKLNPRKPNPRQHRGYNQLEES